MKLSLLSVFVLFLLFGGIVGLQAGDQNIQDIRKAFDDDESNYTNVGNIGITISNFGTIGHGWRYWPRQPSVEYPLGSGIEHMFLGGLWVGGYRDGRDAPDVTTAALDIPSVQDVAEGFEFTNAPGDLVIERSSLADSPYYHPTAISHQDFYAEYTDSNTTIPGTPTSIPGHNHPLHISVRQESYAWNYPFADAFVIINFMVRNTGTHGINDMYVGHWSDMVVRNTNITGRPAGSAFYQHVAQGWVPEERLAYAFDYDGDPGFTDSYVAVKVLGVEHVDLIYTVGEDGLLGERVREENHRFLTNDLDHNFNAWQFRDQTHSVYFSPQTDSERYDKMAIPLQQQYIDPLRLSGNNMMTLVSSGPVDRIEGRELFEDPATGEMYWKVEAVNFVIAVVAAKKVGPEPARLDTEEQREQLMLNAEWAQRAFNGEDRDGTGEMSPDEEWTDGTPENPRPQRYILPSPPNSPRVRVEPGDREVTIYWDRDAEDSVDPITGREDWEGYRLYRTSAGADIESSGSLLQEFVKMAEFDKESHIGYNTGFSAVRLDELVTFPDDPVEYHYRFHVPNLLNGWQYAFSVTAFDEGDPEIGLESLESSRLFNAVRVIPGTPPTSEVNTEIGVYPNPYYGSAAWDGRSPDTGDIRERERKITFFNLPARATIRVYTLAGDLVKTMHHESDAFAGEGEWFNRFSSDDVVFSGGEYSWDLITDFDQAIATGMYLFVVEDLETGNVKRGRFLIVK